jgi:uncharacterized membrane protein YoaT (DUF817 family)
MKGSIALLFFLVGTIAMVLLYSHELLLLAAMGAASLVILYMDKWKRTKHFLVAMLVGGACENMAVFLGAWDYANAGYLWAPLWLPVGWGMAVVLLEETFSKDAPVTFSKVAMPLAFGGTILTGINFFDELYILGCFAVVTVVFFVFGYFKRSELKMGLAAAVLGTAMETANIIAGNWQYSAAMLGTPLWLPLCWFNAFLIMRRVMRIGEKE